MDEIIWKLARSAGLDDVDIRKLRVYTENLISEKDKEIQILKDKLFIAEAQNGIYKGALYDSY